MKMAERQPLNATFFAFKKRDRGGVLFGASVAFVIMAIVLIGVFVALFGSSLGPVINWYMQVIQASASQDTAAMEALGLPPEFFSLIAGLLLWLFPYYILCAAYEAACLRWMIHGEQVGFMGLSLGAQTWRVWSCYWMWFLLNLAFSIVMSIVMGVLIGVLTVSSQGDPTAMLTAMPVMYIVQYGLMIYFSVRFAPAAATTIARRKFSFFDAWTVTKGRFWALFGAFFLLWLIYLIVAIILAVAMFATVLAPAAPSLSTAAAGDPEQFGQALLQVLSQPQSWVVLGVFQIIGLFIGAIFYVAMYGVNARAAIAALDEGKIKPAAA
jgi:hypothetical protein